MASNAQIDANRANSAKSTGPVTPEGKAVASRNSITHGLTSKQLVLPHESAEEFETMKDDAIVEMKPVGTLELAAVLSTVAAWWAVRRAKAVETAFLDTRSKAIAKENPELTPEQAMAEIFACPAEMARMRLMMRYVKAAETTHKQARAEFNALVAERLRAEGDAREAAELAEAERLEAQRAAQAKALHGKFGSAWKNSGTGDPMASLKDFYDNLGNMKLPDDGLDEELDSLDAEFDAA